MKNNLDENIKKIFKEHRSNELTKETKDVIDNTLSNLNSNNRNNKKHVIHKVAACFAVLVIGCGAVFAKEIKNFTQNIFNYDIQGVQGVQVAVDKGYIQNVDMEYIECNDAKFKIDYVTMDDTNLALNFNFLFNESAEGFRGVAFCNMKIYDDKGMLIFTDEERFPNDGITLGAEIVKPIYVNGNNVVESFFIESDRFPRTKSLRATFDKIVLYNENHGNPITKELNGNFDITVDLEEKFYNRENIEYNVDYMEGDKNLGVERAFVTDTSFNLIIDNPNIANISIEVKDQNQSMLYTEQEILAHEINDESGKRIVKIDKTKYDDLVKDSMEVNIVAYLIQREPLDIYLSNYQDDGYYNVKDINKNIISEQESKIDIKTISAKYILTKVCDK